MNLHAGEILLGVVAAFASDLDAQERRLAVDHRGKGRVRLGLTVVKVEDLPDLRLIVDGLERTITSFLKVIQETERLAGELEKARGSL